MADWRKIRAQVWHSWLAGLPDEIYDKRDTAHIVRLLDALCGDSGVGYLRKRLILKRLQTSLYETRYSDLDTVYSAIFALPRLASEQYQYREDALLLWSEIQEMDIKDARYRQRIWWYMLSFQYGGTVKGVALAAQAATGLRCEVVDGCVYYRSAGVPEEYQGDMSGEPINYNGSIDFNGATILIDTDGELTAEQRYYLSTITARLRPVDVHYTFMTRKELMERLCFSDFEDEMHPPVSVEASSRWWNVVRMVTGRPDWGLHVAGNEWIEASVTKEAPQQLLVNSQESEYDFTPMVSRISASSEHVGRYNNFQRAIFKSFAAKGANSTKGALNALSQASSRLVANGYYGDDVIIDGAYPSSYISQLTSFFQEVGRSHRYWSSDEREGSEWIEFEIKRLVPVNYVSFAIFRKPVRVSLYFSSYKDENGERVWVQAKDKFGHPIVFNYREWGGTASGEMVAVEFDVRRALCDAFRLEFERLDIDHYTIVSDDTYVIDDFNWSVECSDVSVKYRVKSEDDFIPTTYEDMFGNRVDTMLRTLDAERAIDGKNDTYWVSQPNVGESAVEYLILKLADEPVRINFIDIEAIYSGCQMNVYSTQEAEPKNWIPYPQVYTLQSGRVELPMRKVTYVKLEFTTLCATPYDVTQAQIEVHTRRFPWDAREYVENRATQTYELSTTQRLLTTPDDALYDDGTPANIIGIEDVYAGDIDETQIVELAADETELVTSNATSSLTMLTNESYSQFQDNSIVAYYGEDMAYESSGVVSPDAVTFGSPSMAYRFSEVGPHVYDEQEYERTANLAYVVGIKDVTFGYNGRIFTAQQWHTFYLYMQDGRFIDINDGWNYVSDERLQVSRDDRLNYFETVELQSIYPFRTFEMFSNQKPPVEKFAYPSDMAREWHGYGSDVEAVEFGLSGTTLRMLPSAEGAGVESEPKLTRSMAIAKAQVDVYPLDAGRWEFECYDLFGESIFNLFFDLEPLKWQTVGATFVPVPGGSWWDSDYPFRVMIPLEGPIARDTVVFVPVVDLDALRNSSVNGTRMMDADYTKLRLTYFNGISVTEIPIDMTDNMEIWFRVQQDIPFGASANGRYDFDRQTFQGVYHLYFGGNTPASDEPKRDYRDVFDNGPIQMIADVAWSEIADMTWGDLYDQDISWGFDEFRQDDEGTLFLKPNDRVEVEDEFFLPDKGFVSFEVELDDGLQKIRDITQTVVYHTWQDFCHVYEITWGELSDNLTPWQELRDSATWGEGVNYRHDPTDDKTWGYVKTMSWGSTGVADVRFLMDYKDQWKAIQAYTYEKQFVFVIKDSDGFESSFVSLEEDLLTSGLKSHILLEWDVKGTAEVTKAEVWKYDDVRKLTWQDLLAWIVHPWYEVSDEDFNSLLTNGDGHWGANVLYDENPEREQHTYDYTKRYPSGLQVKNVDPNDKHRRWVGVWIDSATQRRCIPNVYDEKHYIDTDKVY